MRYGPSTLQLLIFLPTTTMGSPLPTLSSCPRAQGTHRCLCLQHSPTPKPIQTHSESSIPLQILRLSSLSSCPFDVSGLWKRLLSLLRMPQVRGSSQLTQPLVAAAGVTTGCPGSSHTQGMWDSPCWGQTSPTSTDTSFSPGKHCKGYQERELTPACQS